MRFHFDRTRNFARAKNLQPVAQLLDQAESGQPIHRERIPGQPFEVPQIHDREMLLENVGEAALGQPAVERHLTALETAHDAVTGDGPRAFVSARRRLSPARTHAAADALFPVLLPGRWFE